MNLKVFLLFFYVVLIEAAYEGDRCVQDGVPGVCTNLKRCQSAIQTRKNRGSPQICSFDNSEPIVCCVDQGTIPNPPPARTGPASKPRPAVPVPPPAPAATDSSEEDEDDGECAPLSPTMTAKKTGEKAFDKCIEYQEQLVYPCEKGVSLLGTVGRSNYCHHNADELIIGGRDAAQYEFPHMVILGYGKTSSDIEWLCGGSLISERFILTAGHCIATRDTAVSHVLVGALKRSETADKSKIYKVKKIIPHPDYHSPIKYNDIALLELEKPVKLDQFTVPACVHTGEPVNETEVLATGWGHTQNNDFVPSPAETLQRVILKKFSTGVCTEKFRDIRLMKQGFSERTQTCYGDSEVSRDTCPGDSGGPIQIKNKQIYCMYTVVGVTSFGKACGLKDKPAIYTRVANYVPWIESVVWPN